MPCVRATQLYLEQLRDIGVTESGDAIWLHMCRQGNLHVKQMIGYACFLAGPGKFFKKLNTEESSF